jgi:hypothetical protein
LPPDQTPYLPPSLATLLQRGEPHMAYPEAKAELVITGLERPINLHLLKLMAVEHDEEQARHWRRELLSWLHDVATIRLKPQMKTAKARFYDRILFDEPFGGTEAESVAARVEGFAWDGYRLRDSLDHDRLAAALKAFHQRFAAGCARAEMTRSAIATLLDEHFRLAR